MEDKTLISRLKKILVDKHKIPAYTMPYGLKPEDDKEDFEECFDNMEGRSRFDLLQLANSSYTEGILQEAQGEVEKGFKNGKDDFEIEMDLDYDFCPFADTLFDAEVLVELNQWNCDLEMFGDELGQTFNDFVEEAIHEIDYDDFREAIVNWVNNAENKNWLLRHSPETLVSAEEAEKLKQDREKQKEIDDLKSQMADLQVRLTKVLEK